MKSFSILFGVCGIGRGHIYEMLPIIEFYVKKQECRVAIFAFGESFTYFQKKFRDSEKVRTYEVSIPWIHGGPSGLDYSRTAQDSLNQRSDFVSRNFIAMDQAYKFMGKPFVVITDYEPVSAMYAYSLDVPLVTIDQQSKYLLSGYPEDFVSLTPNEERARLSMFFPRVNLRIINTFFSLPTQKEQTVQYSVYGPIIREEIITLKNDKQVNPRNVLVYLSSYSAFVQSPSEVLHIFEQFPEFEFFIFTAQIKEYNALQEHIMTPNVHVDTHGDTNFLEVMRTCRSLICTAGHTLLSEAMYLGKPVFAIPLRTYEQHYSAHVIQDGGFGMTAVMLEEPTLRDFLISLSQYEDAIRLNKDERLFQSPAQGKIIEVINYLLFKS